MITDSIWHQEPDTTQTNTGRGDGQEQTMGLCTLNTVSNSERDRERGEIVHVFASVCVYLWFGLMHFYITLENYPSYFSHIIQPCLFKTNHPEIAGH